MGLYITILDANGQELDDRESDNIFQMGGGIIELYEEGMIKYGMAFESGFDEDALADWNEQLLFAEAPDASDETGIPTYKMSSSNWNVTRGEITRALAAWERNKPTDPAQWPLADETDNGELWMRWLAFLFRSAQYGGFNVS